MVVLELIIRHFLVSCRVIKPFCPVVPCSRCTWYTFIGLTCDLSRPHLCIDMMFCSILQLLQEIIKAYEAQVTLRNRTSDKNIRQGICTAQSFMNNAQGLRRKKKCAQLLTFCQDQSHPSLAEVPHDLCGRTTSYQTPPESVYPFNSDLGILEIIPHHHSSLHSLEPITGRFRPHLALEESIQRWHEILSSLKFEQH